ncbi:MAG: cupredoxin domain-containing protein [Thermoproteota archaeon]|nr:cupredoxin domain-containing protein [Thermoproteota archaeon]
MKNNIIAIVAISFTVVGTMWAVSNLISSNNATNILKHEGILLIAKDNLFNSTNPDIHVKSKIPTRITIVNKDFTKHDFIINDLNINTGYLSSDQDFTTAIASNSSGIYEYYCSFHPATMHGRILVDS